MKYVILENDMILPRDMKAYVEGKDQVTIIYNANNVDTDELLTAFTEFDVLVFQPTMITWGQYNSALMFMWRLKQAGQLGIREIHILYDAEEVTKELTELWGDKREYLDEVLEVVKIYSVLREKIEIDLATSK